MDLNEIFAEKTRAALTRDPSAIRDFFDIWYAREQGFDFTQIKHLIQQKIADLPFSIPDTPDPLQNKIPTELNPVLSKENREAFDLPTIHAFILSFKP
jgi:vacuolar-type H+-ATPase subunit C/Vma6